MSDQSFNVKTFNFIKIQVSDQTGKKANCCCLNFFILKFSYLALGFLISIFCVSALSFTSYTIYFYFKNGSPQKDFSNFSWLRNVFSSGYVPSKIFLKYFITNIRFTPFCIRLSRLVLETCRVAIFWCQCSILIKFQRNNQPSLGIGIMKISKE